MSTSLYYHGFGVRGYKYVHTKFDRGRLTIRVRPCGKLVRCPACGKSKVIRKGLHLRALRTVPIGTKPVWLHVEVPRVQCLACGCIRKIRLPLARARCSYTRAFERYVLELVKCMTIKDVSNFLGVGWDCVKSIYKRRLEKKYGRPKLYGLRYIAIDEISVRKGHKYLTLVMDLESGIVVFVGDGKGGKALEPFWEQLRRSRAKIVAVATDLSPAYIGSVLGNLQNPVLVFDHFHVVKLMNEALSEIRRSLHHELKDAMKKDVLKGARWILLKNPENLNLEKDEAQHLQEALRLNEPLAQAYYLKEELRLFWNQVDMSTASAVIDSWIAQAESTGIRQLQKMANTVASHQFGILSWYEHPISSGPLEGTNNKIKVLKRQAYGYRDKEFFKLRIMAIHEAKYSLTG